jgi:hypothetical protein
MTASAFAMLGLDQRAAVYTRSPDGTHSVPGLSAVPVRVCGISTEGAGLERSELAGSRTLLWGPLEALPEGCEVEVSGERWTAVRGTQARLRGPDGGVVYQRCDLVRADG